MDVRTTESVDRLFRVAIARPGEFIAAKHAAGNLGDQDAAIHTLHTALEAGIFLADFTKVIGNFLQQYRKLGDSWMLFNNSREKPEIIASMKGDKLSIIAAQEYEGLSGRYGEK